MNRLLWPVFLIALVLSGCGNGTPTRQNDFTPVTSIEISATSPTLALNTTTKLTATGNRQGLLTSDITGQVVWTSDSPTNVTFTTLANPNRAWVTVNATGPINVTATFTNTSGSVVSATFKLTVTNAVISTMTISPLTPSVHKGFSTQFTATGTFSDLTTQDMTFDATWNSDATNVATVSDIVGSKGFARALAEGSTTINAAFGVNGATLLTVTAPLLQSITISPANPSVLSLSTATFTATGNFSDGTTADITSLITTWSSNNTTIATIVANTGVATTLAQGTPTISATLANADGTPITGSTTLNVTGGTLQSIAIKPVSLTGTPLILTNSTLAQNTAVRIAAIGTFNTGATRDITGVVAWTTGSGGFATVIPAGGNLAFLNAGPTATLTPTTVTATSGTVTTTINLNITAATRTSFTISTLTMNVTAGTSSRFILFASFDDGTSEDVTASSTWVSGDTTIATVGNLGIAKGRVTGVAAGPVTITPTFGGASPPTPPTVTVTSRVLNGLTISLNSGSLSSGNQVKYTTVASYIDGTTVDVTEDTTWSIADSNVAIVPDSLSQPGHVVAVNTGSTTLTASFGGVGGITQTATVTVP